MKGKITKATMEGVSREYCYAYTVCKEEETIHCSSCKFFKNVVVPTWWKDIEWKQSKKLNVHKETDKYEEVQKALRRNKCQ